MTPSIQSKNSLFISATIISYVFFTATISWAQTLRVCYVPDSRSTSGDKGYTFDGIHMVNNATPKLLNTANFGSAGIVKRTITPVPITANPITTTAIAAANCGAIFVGSFGQTDGTIGTVLGDAELNVIRTWSTQSITNLVIVSQAEATAWGYKNVNGNVNPNSPTVAGAATKIFNGPFGIVSSYNQGGTYQGSIAGGSSIALGEDATKRPTIALDIPTGDIVLGDVDILTDLGGISFGASITNNNDRLFANIWAYAADLTSTERSLLVSANSVFVDNGLSGGTAGNCTKDGGESVPDVSTKPLYVKMVSGTSVVQIAQLQADGSFQFTSVPDGTYTLLLDDSNVVTDVTPLATGGTVSWRGTIASGTPSTLVKFCLLNCPVVPITTIAGSTSFCAGQSAPLSVSVSGGSGSYNYQWKQGTTNVGVNNNSFAATAAGVYSVVVADTKGCLSTSSSLTVTQKPTPVASITANGSTAILSNAQVMLSTTMAAGQTYQWSRDGAVLSGATSNTYAASQQGSYAVTVTSDGCSTMSTTIAVNIVLANEPVPAGFSMNVYPNPTESTVTINVENISSQPLRIYLFNINGQAIYTWEVKPSVREQSFQTELPTAGHYILRAENGRGALQNKVIRK